MAFTFQIFARHGSIIVCYGAQFSSQSQEGKSVKTKTANETGAVLPEPHQTDSTRLRTTILKKKKIYIYIYIYIVGL
jgi:hypothetical protein